MLVKERREITGVLDGIKIQDIQKELESRLPPNVDPSTAFLDINYGYEYTEVFLQYYREETKTEFSARVKREEEVKLKAKKAQAATLQKEREEYERLKKIYGN